jgi:hypothetical protein
VNILNVLEKIRPIQLFVLEEELAVLIIIALAMRETLAINVNFHLAMVKIQQNPLFALVKEFVIH